MKRKFYSFPLLIFLLLLITSSTTEPARPLSTKEGEDKIKKLNLITEGGWSHFELEDDASLDKLLGLEICEHEDEECLKRRMASEAHLDYIYTQHHKP